MESVATLVCDNKKCLFTKKKQKITKTNIKTTVIFCVFLFVFVLLVKKQQKTARIEKERNKNKRSGRRLLPMPWAFIPFQKKVNQGKKHMGWVTPTPERKNKIEGNSANTQ